MDFTGTDLSGAEFREVDLSRARMRGVLLINADIDGAVGGLRLNGVDVAPLVEAELDRLHPERIRLRPTTVEGMREAWTVIEAFWATTMARASTLSEAELHRSVDDEWSFAQTLRHLVFVIDAWLGHAIEGHPAPFHPLGLPASFITNGAEFGIDAAAEPAFDEVVAARDDRVTQMRRFLAGLTQDDADRVRAPNDAPGYPPAAARSAASCLRVIFNEEWTHHQFAIRDLAIIEAQAA